MHDDTENDVATKAIGAAEAEAAEEEATEAEAAEEEATEAEAEAANQRRKESHRCQVEF